MLGKDKLSNILDKIHCNESLSILEENSLVEYIEELQQEVITLQSHISQFKEDSLILQDTPEVIWEEYKQLKIQNEDLLEVLQVFNQSRLILGIQYEKELEEPFNVINISTRTRKGFQVLTPKQKIAFKRYLKNERR